MKNYAICLTLLLLTGCASFSATECSFARIISVSKDDVLTRRTAEQIVANNEGVERNCRG